MKKAVTKSQAKAAVGVLGGKPLGSMAPHLDLDEQVLPAIKSWSVGQKYKITLEVEMVSQRKGAEYDNNPSKMSAGFKVLSASSGGK